MGNHKLETFIGIGLLLIAVLAFIFTLVSQLPKTEDVKAQAQPIPEIPVDFFSDKNEVANQIRALNLPGNIPVSVESKNLGRNNVFENF